MRAPLDDAALFKDKDQIRFANGAEAMSDNERRAAAEEQFESALQAGFSDAIDGTRSLNKNNDARIT